MWKGLTFVYRFVEGRVLKTADGVIVFNKPDGMRLRALRPDVHVAKTWFNGEVFFPSGRPDDAEPAICWVGRLEEQKDPRLAIAVMDRVRRSVPTIRLTIVGDGSLRKELEADIRARKLQPHVLMRGSVSRTEVAQVMRDSRCLLMTSHYEGSPRVLVEANASGVPVVAPSGGDPDNVLKRDINGWCVESRDPDMLAHAVMECLHYKSSECVSSTFDREVNVCVGEILAIGS
jgi:glycosyltransferase involved in cell wall biosynthesis